MIYFDNIVYSLQRSGGISVYWNELLSRVMNDNEFSCKFIEYSNSKQKNYFRKNLHIPDQLIIKLSAEFLKIKRYINPSLSSPNRFIFHSSYYRICSNKKAINVCTVHDFTYEYFVKGPRKIIHNWQKYRAIRKSNYIICISENTKRDLLKFLPDVEENKIRVIYNGVSDDYFPLDITKFDNFLPYRPYTYVLFVGERDGYKNFKLSVESISKTNLNLLIVGKDLLATELSFLDKKLDKKRYKQIKNVANEELNCLYNGAFCLLYPSSYEGFGIPVIEAQKAGCPVIAYNNSSISEIIGETPLLINSLEINEILNKFNLLDNSIIRHKVISSGLTNSSTFSWEKMYYQLKLVYQEALNDNF